MVDECLRKLGCNPNNLGYEYLKDLLEYALVGEKIEPLSKCGYVMLGEKYKKSVNSIEKNIQNCINNAWIYGDNNYLYKYFGETISDIKGKPTNKHFIFTIIEKLNLE